MSHVSLMVWITSGGSFQYYGATTLEGMIKHIDQFFYVVTLRRGRPRPREQLLLQNYKA